jgi:hypothetical protein
MRRVKTFDHFDSRTAFLSDLVDISSLHQQKANIRVTQAVRRSPVAVAVKLQAQLIQDRVEQLSLAPWEEAVRRLWLIPRGQSLEWPDRADCALAVSDAPLSSHLDFQDRFASCIIDDDCDITVLEPLRIVQAEPGIRLNST